MKAHNGHLINQIQLKNYKNMKDKIIWKKEYTLVIIANAVYIILFYFIMVAYK